MLRASPHGVAGESGHRCLAGQPCCGEDARAAQDDPRDCARDRCRLDDALRERGEVDGGSEDVVHGERHDGKPHPSRTSRARRPQDAGPAQQRDPLGPQQEVAGLGRRDASLMPQGMGAPADDAARMRPDRTLSPEGDAPLARRRGSLEPDHLEHDVTSALPRGPTCPSGSRPAARPLLRSTRPPRHPPDLRSRPGWRDPRRSGDWSLPRNDLRGRAGRSPLTADRAPRTRSSEPQPFRQWAAGASVRDDLWTRVGAGLVDRGDDAASVGPRSTQPQRPVVPVLAGAALRPSGTPWRGASPRTPSPGTRSASPGACMVSPCRFRSPGCRAART
jgi:hypothetical protein